MSDTTDAEWASMEWNYDFVGDSTLDLSSLKLLYEDTFSDISNVVSDTRDDGDWYTPGHPNHNNARLKDIEDHPELYEQIPEGLRCHIQLVGANDHKGTNLQTVNTEGVGGYIGTMGYWEARLRFDDASGSFWPAFWLYSVSRHAGPFDQTMVELDVIEAYSRYPAGQQTSNFQTHSVVHLVPAANPLPGNRTQRVTHSAIQTINPQKWGEWVNLFDGEFHTYGLDITDDWLVYYLDRRELCRHPMVDEARNPLYALLSTKIWENNGNGGYANAADTYMDVDYVRHYGAPMTQGSGQHTHPDLEQLITDANSRIDALEQETAMLRAKDDDLQSQIDTHDHVPPDPTLKLNYNFLLPSGSTMEDTNT